MQTRFTIVAALLLASCDLSGLGNLGSPLELIPEKDGNLVLGMEFDVRVLATRDGADVPCADRPLSTCSTGESYRFELETVRFEDATIGEVVAIDDENPLSAIITVRAIGEGRTRLRVDATVQKDGTPQRETAYLSFDVIEIARAPMVVKCLGNSLLFPGALGPNDEALEGPVEMVVLADPRGHISANHLPFGPDGERLPEPVFVASSEPPELFEYEAPLTPGLFTVTSNFVDQSISSEVIDAAEITEWRYVALAAGDKPDSRMRPYTIPRPDGPYDLNKYEFGRASTTSTTFRLIPFAGERWVCTDEMGLPDGSLPRVVSRTPSICDVPEVIYESVEDLVHVEHLAAGTCKVDVHYLDQVQTIEYELVDNPDTE